MLLVITTQTQENYGAHDWDGKNECPQYWKFKGGQEFKVTGVGANMDHAAIVESVRKDIEEDNDYFRVDIVSWSVESDSYLSWFEQSQLDYDGSIQCAEPTIALATIKVLA